MIKNLRKIRNAAVLLVISLLLSGCLEIEYHIQIKPDGMESVTCKVIMPAILAGQSGIIAEALEDQGYKVNIESEGDKYYVVGTRISPKNEWFLPHPGRFVKEKVVFEPSHLNLLVVKRYYWKTNFVLDRDEVNKAFSESSKTIYTENIRIPFRYVISVPGNISKHNADEIQANKMVWKYTIRPGEKVDMEFTSYDINYPVIIILLLIFVVGGGFSIWKAGRSRKMYKKVVNTKNVFILLVCVICLAIGLFFGLIISKQPGQIKGSVNEVGKLKVDLQTQATKAKMTEVTNAMSNVASAVAAYYEDINSWPHCNDLTDVRTSLGVSIATDKISSITVDSPRAEEVTITATIRGIDSAVDGKTLALKGTSRAKEDVRWMWSGTVPSVYIPK